MKASCSIGTRIDFMTPPQWLGQADWSIPETAASRLHDPSLVSDC
jgi:hypothetical protein